MDDRVRVGLVGLGRMGRFHAANLAGRIPLPEIEAVTLARELAGALVEICSRLEMRRAA